MDSDDIIRRFQREEFLLASLNHPNIAQLYGSGITAEGIPFFAMEYVEGTRIDEYCNESSYRFRRGSNSSAKFVALSITPISTSSCIAT